jgi:hypothetical protein
MGVYYWSFWGNLGRWVKQGGLFFAKTGVPGWGRSNKSLKFWYWYLGKVHRGLGFVSGELATNPKWPN